MHDKFVPAGNKVGSTTSRHHCEQGGASKDEQFEKFANKMGKTMVGDYGMAYSRIKKYVQKKGRCMIQSTDPQEYCDQFCGLLLDYMFKFDNIQDRTFILRLVFGICFYCF